MPQSSSSSWIVSQVGNREHYAIARGLAQRNLLTTLVTDLWRPSWIPTDRVNQLKWKPLQRWMGRSSEGLVGKVAHFNVESVLATAWHYGRRPKELYTGHIEYGRWFARKTARLISRDRAAGVFFGYNTACLEALVVAKRRGLFTIVDQIDPAQEEWQLVEAERRRFPGWEAPPPEEPTSYWRRLRAEWDLADLVVVNSDWSREALLKQGVPPEKLAVVPLAYDPPSRSLHEPRRPDAPLQVLWLGTVTLRKGIPYLLEAAAKLPHMQFHVAGPVLISPRVVRDAPSNVRFYGQVPQLLSGDHFRSADVFLLPTISDGFAITQLEAMAWGLPVIATAHCGKVVIDGHNGFVVPVRDADAIVSRLTALDGDRPRLAALSNNASASLAGFRLDVIVDKLLAEVDRVRANRPV
jgi:glycosyltransferase involved in cell wall biosynthesis